MPGFPCMTLITSRSSLADFSFCGVKDVDVTVIMLLCVQQLFDSGKGLAIACAMARWPERQDSLVVLLEWMKQVRTCSLQCRLGWIQVAALVQVCQSEAAHSTNIKVKPACHGRLHAGCNPVACMQGLLPFAVGSRPFVKICLQYGQRVCKNMVCSMSAQSMPCACDVIHSTFSRLNHAGMYQSMISCTRVARPESQSNEEGLCTAPTQQQQSGSPHILSHGNRTVLGRHLTPAAETYVSNSGPAAVCCTGTLKSCFFLACQRYCWTAGSPTCLSPAIRAPG